MMTSCGWEGREHTSRTHKAAHQPACCRPGGTALPAVRAPSNTLCFHFHLLYTRKRRAILLPGPARALHAFSCNCIRRCRHCHLKSAFNAPYNVDLPHHNSPTFNTTPHGAPASPAAQELAARADMDVRSKAFGLDDDAAEENTVSYEVYPASAGERWRRACLQSPRRQLCAARHAHMLYVSKATRDAAPAAARSPPPPPAARCLQMHRRASWRRCERSCSTTCCPTCAATSGSAIASSCS